MTLSSSVTLAHHHQPSRSDVGTTSHNTLDFACSCCLPELTASVSWPSQPCIQRIQRRPRFRVSLHKEAKQLAIHLLFHLRVERKSKRLQQHRPLHTITCLRSHTEDESSDLDAHDFQLPPSVSTASAVMLRRSSKASASTSQAAPRPINTDARTPQVPTLVRSPSKQHQLPRKLVHFACHHCHHHGHRYQPGPPRFCT